MKTTFTLICSLVLLAGCTAVHVNEKGYWEVVSDYRSIKQGMTEEEVVARLGPPEKTEVDGAILWRHEWYSGQYARLSVTFDADRRVSETKLRSDAKTYPGISDLLVNPPPPPGTYTSGPGVSPVR